MKTIFASLPLLIRVCALTPNSPPPFTILLLQTQRPLSAICCFRQIFHFAVQFSWYYEMSNAILILEVKKVGKIRHNFWKLTRHVLGRITTCITIFWHTSFKVRVALVKLKNKLENKNPIIDRLYFLSGLKNVQCKENTTIWCKQKKKMS